MNYISIVTKNRDGGYLIPDNEDGRKVVNLLLKEDPSLIYEGLAATPTSPDEYIKYSLEKLMEV